MLTNTSSLPILLRACNQETLERPPVWMMRQAGRYLPEYQAVRGKVSFLGLCKNIDLAVEVSLQPLRRFGMDGVIMFSDILVPVEAMGMALEFNDKGPSFPAPISSASDIEALVIPDPVEKTGYVMTILKTLRQSLVDYPDVALIGFAGSPWTLASYMLEGGTSRNYTNIKRLMMDEPKVLHALLDKLSQTIILYLNAQIEAGAQVVQLFDTWAGILPRAQYQEFVLPYHQKIIGGLNRQNTPVILYVNGSRGLLDLMAQSGADVLSIDNLTPLSEARSILGSQVILQGNLDSNLLFCQPETLKPITEAMIQDGGSKGYIFNLGHGILPKTPVENVKLVVDTVKQTSFKVQLSQMDEALTPLGV